MPPKTSCSEPPPPRNHDVFHFLSDFLQEILEEVRKELQKVKEEIIGGEISVTLEKRIFMFASS